MCTKNVYTRAQKIPRIPLRCPGNFFLLKVTDCLSDIVSHIVSDMVCIMLGHIDMSVAEPVLDSRKRNAGIQQHCCMGMPERMKIPVLRNARAFFAGLAMDDSADMLQDSWLDKCAVFTGHDHMDRSTVFAE